MNLSPKPPVNQRKTLILEKVTVNNVLEDSEIKTTCVDGSVSVREVAKRSSESYHTKYNSSLFGGSSPVCEVGSDINSFQDPFQKCFLENTETRSKTVSTCHTVIREAVCYAIKQGKMKLTDPLLDMELPVLVSKLLLCRNFTDTERTLLCVYAKNFRHAACHSGRPLYSTFEFTKFFAGIVQVLHALARYPAILSNKQGLRIEKEFIASILEMKAMSKADPASFYTLIGATCCSDPNGLTVALLGSIQKADIVKSMSHHLEDIEDLAKEFLYRFFGYCTHDGDLLETLQQLLEQSSGWRDSFVTERRVFRLFPGVQAAQLISRYIRIVKEMGISKLLSLPEAVEFLSTPIELLIAFGVKPKRMIHFWDLFESVTQSYLVNRDVIETPTSQNVTQSTTSTSRKVRISFKNSKGAIKVLNKDLHVALHWTVAEYLEKRELKCGNGKEWLCEFSDDGSFHKDDEVFGLEGVGYTVDIILSIVDKITLD
ncbi:hypothetical protein HDU79_001396 [Rhizoclosmatium sp. JEL0117]|nr:hypothetical protein HDU79_001396 [Rhizoclosmatium sp. JEL0117]